MKTELIVLGTIIGAAVAIFSTVPTATSHQTSRVDAVVHLYPTGAGGTFDSIVANSDDSRADIPTASTPNKEAADELDTLPPAAEVDAGVRDASAPAIEAVVAATPIKIVSSDRGIVTATPSLSRTANPYDVTVTVTRDDGSAPRKEERQGACAKSQVECSGACVNTRNDPSNCGECGLVCPNEHAVSVACVSGVCRVSQCVSGWENCDDRSDCETNITTSEHCGSCLNSCPAISIGGRSQRLACVSGVCIPPAGITECSGAYVDTSSTHQHCGACGHSCSEGQNCLGGRCVCANVAKCGSVVTNSQ